MLATFLGAIVGYHSTNPNRFRNFLTHGRQHENRGKRRADPVVELYKLTHRTKKLNDTSLLGLPEVSDRNLDSEDVSENSFLNFLFRWVF